MSLRLTEILGVGPRVKPGLPLRVREASHELANVSQMVQASSERIDKNTVALRNLVHRMRSMLNGAVSRSS